MDITVDSVMQVEMACESLHVVCNRRTQHIKCIILCISAYDFRAAAVPRSAAVRAGAFLLLQRSAAG